MRTTRAILVAIALTAVLGGCGKNPAAAPEGERSIKALGGIRKASATTPVVPRTAASTSSAKATTTKATTKLAPGPQAQAPANGPTPPQAPAAPAAPKPPAAVNPAGPGALHLGIKVWGTTPVGSLVLKVTNQADPTETATVPLKLTGPQAAWEQAEIAPGKYTLHVTVLDPAGAKLGFGATEAIVKAGELSDVTLDVGIDNPTPTPKPTTTGSRSEREPGGAPGGTVAGDEDPAPVATPTPTPSATPAPTGPGWGGTLGLRVEIF